LLAELNVELWIGGAAVIRTKRVRKQKTDHQDAQLILQLMMEDRFPRIWVASTQQNEAGRARGRHRKAPPRVLPGLIAHNPRVVGLKFLEGTTNL
jgi:hypothetical protein